MKLTEILKNYQLKIEVPEKGDDPRVLGTKLSSAQIRQLKARAYEQAIRAILSNIYGEDNVKYHERLYNFISDVAPDTLEEAREFFVIEIDKQELRLASKAIGKGSIRGPIYYLYKIMENAAGKKRNARDWLEHKLLNCSFKEIRIVRFGKISKIPDCVISVLQDNKIAIYDAKFYSTRMSKESVIRVAAYATYLSRILKRNGYKLQTIMVSPLEFFISHSKMYSEVARKIISRYHILHTYHEFLMAKAGINNLTVRITIVDRPIRGYRAYKAVVYIDEKPYNEYEGRIKIYEGVETEAIQK